MALPLILSFILHISLFLILNLTRIPQIDAGLGNIRSIAMVNLQTRAPSVENAPLPLPQEPYASTARAHSASGVMERAIHQPEPPALPLEQPERSAEKEELKHKTEAPAQPKKTTTTERVQKEVSEERQENSKPPSNKDASEGDPQITGEATAGDPVPAEIRKPSAQGEKILDPSSAGVNQRVKPLYPRASRLRHEEGKVTILLDIENGRVMNATVEVSSGHSRLDEAALKALWKWTFTHSGEARVRVPVIFTLEN